MFFFFEHFYDLDPLFPFIAGLRPYAPVLQYSAHCCSVDFTQLGDEMAWLRVLFGNANGRSPALIIRRRALTCGASAASIGAALYLAQAQGQLIGGARADADDAISSDGDAHHSTADNNRVFTRAEVAQHSGPDSVWVTHKGGVYDVTEFVALHPGGAKILLAAGGSVDQYWRIYRQHGHPHVTEILERYRIGDLHPDDVAAEAAAAAAAGAVDPSDPYISSPPRSPVLLVRNEKPYNAEPPLSLLVDSYITPTELLFVRDHLPVPMIDEATYRLEIVPAPSSSANDNASSADAKPQQSTAAAAPSSPSPVTLSLPDLRSLFPKASVVSVLSCAGNRRSHMGHGPSGSDTRGLGWSAGALGNVQWGGARLRDVLLWAGLREEDVGRAIRHIQFEGLDREGGDTGTGYGASIPADRALDPKADVILAWELNGEPIPREHGGPLRVVVPGVTGARQVKWVGKIIASPEQSSSLWQTKDYRVFPPSTEWNTVDFSDFGTSPPIMDMPVTSAICDPPQGHTLQPGQGSVTVKGYAWAGGGRGIARVDVSGDGGKTWTVADVIEGPPDVSPSRNRSWGWTLWQAEVPVRLPQQQQQPEVSSPASPAELELVCRAVDVAHNTQPESPLSHWNYRGLLANAWHRVKVKVPPPPSSQSPSASEGSLSTEGRLR